MPSGTWPLLQQTPHGSFASCYPCAIAVAPLVAPLPGFYPWLVAFVEAFALTDWDQFVVAKDLQEADPAVEMGHPVVEDLAVAKDLLVEVDLA